MEREESKEGKEEGKGKEEEGREERRKVSKMGGKGGSYCPGECQLAGWCCHREEERLKRSNKDCGTWNTEPGCPGLGGFLGPSSSNGSQSR